MDEASIPEQSGPARARDDSPYTASSMSRLRLADLAMHIADRAFALVSVERDEVDSPARATALVETARVVEQFAAELLDAAAIHARTAGATWDDIGDAAELPRQDASVRFGPAAAAWHERSTGRDGLPRGLRELPRGDNTGDPATP